MEILKKNIEAMHKQSMFNNYNMLEKNLEEKELDDFEVYQNFNGDLVVKQENHKGDLIHYTSYYNPYSQAKKMVEGVEFNTNRLTIVCLGIGGGYQVDEILKKINSKSIVIVFEKNISLLKSVLSKKDFSSYIEQGILMFCFSDNIQLQIDKIFESFPFNISKISYVSFEVFDNKYFSFCREIIDYIEEYKELFTFGLGNSPDDTILGLKNTIDNLLEYIKSPGIMDIRKKHIEEYKGKPAIIVASGPSLDKNVAKLKYFQNKAIILSCDASYKTLIKNGIVPDCVGSIERVDETYDAFYKDVEFEEDVVLTSVSVVKKDVINIFAERKRVISMFKNEQHGMWFSKCIGEKGSVISGSSVSHMMCGVARMLECNPIILIGQDLAYSKDGVSHTDGFNDNFRLKVSKEDNLIEDINGDMVYTTPIWTKFLQMYEEIIECDNSGTIYIDATEGGAKIKGTNIIPLKKVLEEYCCENVKSIHEVLDSCNEDMNNENINSITKKAYEKIKKTISDIEEFYDKLEVSIEKNKESKEIIDNNIKNQGELDFIYDSIDYVEDEIVKKLYNIDLMMMLFQYPIVLAAHKINLLDSDVYTFDTLSKNIEIQGELLKVIEKYTIELVDELKRAEGILLEELKFSINN